MENWCRECPRGIVQRLWCSDSGIWPAENTTEAEWLRESTGPETRPAENTIEAEWLMGSTGPGTPLRQGIGSSVCDGTVEEVAGNIWERDALSATRWQGRLQFNHRPGGRLRALLRLRGPGVTYLRCRRRPSSQPASATDGNDADWY